MSDELLPIKQEISKYYLNEFKNELWFFKKMTILPVESNIIKVITWEINEPSNISDIFEWKNDDWFFDKILNRIKKQWWDFFISSELESKLLSFMKEKRKEIESKKTKSELEALKSTIMQQNNQSNQNNQNNHNNQNNQHTQNNQNQRTNNQWNNNWWNNSLRTNYSPWWYANTDRSSTSYEIDHLDFIIPPETTRIYNNLKWVEKPDLEPFACGLKLYNSLKSQWRLKNTKYLTIVDFTKPKSKNRMFVINTETRTVEHAVTCGHGKWSWRWEYATSFSNVVWSNKSSLGWYITPDTITKTTRKSWRYWLRQIQWIESTNSASWWRWIAIHPGGVNWSEWCFTIPRGVATEIMWKQKWWSLLFAYAESKEYFAQSNYFHQNPDGSFTA